MTDMALEVITPAYTLQEAGQRRDELVAFVKNLMVEGVDYGKIPGSKKQSLLKPGAEKLSSFFNLVPQFEEISVEEDWTGARHNSEPFFFYKIRCKLSRGDRVIAECIASINSWESKYRYRKGSQKCPVCGKEAIIKGKQEYGGGWVCFKAKGGCGEKFQDNDQRVTTQVLGNVLNDNIFDQVNTLSKMCQKRALIGAVLIGVNASEMFTQDMEDMVDGNWVESAPQKSENNNQSSSSRKPVQHDKPAAKRAPVSSAPGSDEPPLLDEDGNPAEAAPAPTNRIVDQETGEVTTSAAKPVAQNKPELKKNEIAISAEFIEGALEYRTENGVKMVKWGEKWWRPALETTGKGMTPALTDTLLALFPYPNAGKPTDGKPNQYEAGNHLNNHFKVKLWSSLTWEQVAAVFSWKKFGIPDERWYKKEYGEWKAKDNAKNGIAEAAPVAKAVEVTAKAEVKAAAPVKTVREFYDINAANTAGLVAAEVDAFVANMEGLNDPTVLLPLMVGGMEIKNPKHAEHFFQMAQLLADKSVEVTVDENGQPDGEWKNTLDYIIGQATESK